MAWGTPTSRGSNTDTTGTATDLVISSVSVAQNSLITVAGCLTVDTSMTITMADSAGNTYTVVQQETTAPAIDRTLFIGTAIATTALSSGSITITYGETVGSSCAEVYETTGGAGSSLDSAVTATAAFSTASPSQTSGTPTAPGDLMFGVLAWSDSLINYTEDTGNGWTNLRNKLTVAGPSSNMSAAYQVNAGVGTKTYAPALSSSITGCIAVIGIKIAIDPANFSTTQTLAALTASATMTAASTFTASITLEDLAASATYEKGAAYDPGTQSFLKARAWPYREFRVRR